MVDYNKIPNKHEQEEFWMAFGLLVSSLVQKNKENEVYKEVEELVNAILKLVRGMSGEGVEELKNEALRIREGGGSLERKVRRLFNKLLKIRGYPGLQELAGFIVLHRRCIGCFRKLEKWKWRRSPFITRDHKVFKVGWGVWVVVDKECEDEEFPF
jgi:triphosphoribosyl-dephospho-CoA synthetase